MKPEGWKINSTETIIRPPPSKWPVTPPNDNDPLDFDQIEREQAAAQAKDRAKRRAVPQEHEPEDRGCW